MNFITLFPELDLQHNMQIDAFNMYFTIHSALVTAVQTKAAIEFPVFSNFKK